MRKALVCTTFAFILFAVSAPAMPQDAPGHWKTVLNGYNEVPSISTTGHGLFFARVEDDGIDFELRYDDLEGTPSAAHIHFGQKHTTGGVIAFLCGGGGTDACPANPGVVSGRIEADDVIGPADKGIAAGEFEEVLRAIRAGSVYVNVHSGDLHPGGEIRGQLGRGRSNDSPRGR